MNNVGGGGVSSSLILSLALARTVREGRNAAIRQRWTFTMKEGAKPYVVLNFLCQKGTVILLFFGFSVLASMQSLAQSVMVKPTRIETTGRPGQILNGSIEISSLIHDSNQRVDIGVLDLTQDGEGRSLIAAPELLSASPLLRKRSCSSWVKTIVPSVELPPLGSSTVRYEVRVPPSATGFFCAGIIVQTRPPESQGTVSIVLRFLIPLIIQVDGPLVRNNVDIVGSGLAYEKLKEDSPYQTFAYSRVTNSGQRYSKVGGKLGISKLDAGRWRFITEVPIDERGVMPGSTIRLKADLGRNLPSGHYKVESRLVASGKPLKALTQEVDFVGDPNVSLVAADASLEIQPPRLQTDAGPGAMRRSYLTIKNPNENPIVISASVEQPKQLKGVAAGEMTGDHISCHDYIDIQPATFTLKSGNERKLAVNVSLPKDVSAKPFFYGNIHFRTRYEDGQEAGSADVLFIAENKKVKTAPKLVPSGPLALAMDDDGKYSVLAVFANIGDMHLEPKCNLEVVGALGMGTEDQIEMTREEGLVLPLSFARFNGTLDLKNLDLGVYTLKAVAKYADQEAVQSQVVKVVDGPNGKTLELLELPSDSAATGTAAAAPPQSATQTQ